MLKFAFTMRAFRFPRKIVLASALGSLIAAGSAASHAAELIRITPANYDDVVPAGKETDAIFGDWVLRNGKVVAVIGNPVPGRNANMTVRGVSGMVIDFTRRSGASDQLGCFYPAGGRYTFDQAGNLAVQLDGADPVAVATDESSSTDKWSAAEIVISFRGKAVAEDGTTAVVTYRFTDESDALSYSVTIVNENAESKTLLIEDSLRCDGNLFETATDPGLKLFYAEDRYFGQCYGFLTDQGMLEKSGGRNMTLRPSENAEREVAAGESLSWSGAVYCSQGLPGVRSWAASKLPDAGASAMQPLTLSLKSPQGAVAHALVEITNDFGSLGVMQSDTLGFVRTELQPGNYTVTINAPGQPERSEQVVVESAPRSDTLSFQPASRVRANITDGNGKSIAAKVQFIGLDGTETPNFGPDSAISAIGNAVYCAKGKFEQPIAPGKYRAIISHGPEYDYEEQLIEVTAGKLTQLTSSLPRVVDTEGWISSEFHSHSSPSGDNVSHQTGRVLNLLAEHLEFAPCTEHNRIDTYADDLELLGATADMATCTGMELTGSPLPINHQNAFPLHRHEHTQDNGGPTTDADPVKQIERLALWDDSSSKVVQSNHPNLPQILGDRDLDGKPDDGFRGMLGWMDVVEIHPPQGIFDWPTADTAPRDRGANPTFYWLQLLNLGYRIPGVVNTDAHYNFHGSGWLRNYMASSTDDPAQIDIDEMIHAAEHGHMIMTTGPFLDASVATNRGKFISGDDVDLSSGGEAKLSIRVQCPNWFDVNRVQVFANGRPLEQLNFTRQTSPELFSLDVVRFSHEVILPKFAEDTHVIVATIGEGLKLGPVMGETQGELPPVAVANPIFLDMDGGGFEPNGDDLGVPFMLPEIADQ